MTRVRHLQDPVKRYKDEVGRISVGGEEHSYGFHEALGSSIGLLDVLSEVDGGTEHMRIIIAIVYSQIAKKIKGISSLAQNVNDAKVMLAIDKVRRRTSEP